MKMLKLSLAALFTLGLIGCGNGNAPATHGTLVSISATGEATRVPDMASLSAGVVTEAKDSETAMKSNAEQMEKVVKAIRKAGIEEKDVQTSGISLTPRYEYPPNSAGSPNRPGRTLVGYIARNTVSLKVREIGELGDVLNALTEAGANQIHGPNLEIGEPEPVLAEARLQALEKARARAETYAEALGMEVRRLVSVSEGGSVDMPRPMMRAEMASADARAPVAPGETTLTVNLDLVFELAD
ncbi:SIMPL domain-containing protein [Microbulbifer guangxiensis]|uniref:SIMPL domain-containing protein n=1 Tax=Microbulbifer guangxiensis TaxID=2904249 RepID=UPI001F1BCD28|nr:SIMPL domain-containing protein [Microbulbifer guangxiensis]